MFKKNCWNHQKGS